MHDPPLHSHNLFHLNPGSGESFAVMVPFWAGLRRPTLVSWVGRNLQSYCIELGTEIGSGLGRTSSAP